MVRRLEATIARILRAGTLLSLGIMLLGGVVTLIQHPAYFRDTGGLDAIRQPHDGVRSFGGLVSGLSRAEGEAVMLLGLLLLVVTPVMRVFLSAIAFVRIGDRAFALLTTGVLILLLISFMLGSA
jgi:uncharacterized membrane protein